MLTLRGNNVPLPPTLNRGVIGVSELVGHLADAVETANDSFSAHPFHVRSVRTYVNVENEQRVRDDWPMTIGERLLGLKQRAGLSLDAIAEAAGYNGRSSVQRYFAKDFDGELSMAVAKKLVAALEGKGAPPIVANDVLALMDLSGVFEARPTDMLAPRYLDLPRDVPVYGGAIGTYHLGDDEVIEQTLVQRDDPIDYFLRPPGQAERTGLYGVYIAGSSQSPRFEDGDIAYADPNTRPMIGDDVLVYLRNGPDQHGGDNLVAVLVKRIVKRTSEFIELQQFNPPMTFRIETRRVSAVHRVLPNKEMLASW